MSGEATVVIADFLAEPLDVERAVLGDIAEVVALEAVDESDLTGRTEDADAVMLYHFIVLGPGTIAGLRKCRLIQRGGVGVDNVDLSAAESRGIAVANVPDYGTEEVADSAVGMALALARGTHFLNSRLRRSAGGWTYSQGAPVPRLRGRVFGIVGCGRIGTAAALRAKAFGFDVVFYDPYLADGVEKALGVRRAWSLDELLTQSHVLSLHCPLTVETRGLIGADALTRLPAGAVLINTARGGIVDTAVLPEALASGQLGGAGIDVLPEEPPPAGDPLVEAWRDPDHPAHDLLILNPHAAFYCEEGIREIRQKGAENIRRALLGEPLRNVVGEGSRKSRV